MTAQRQEALKPVDFSTASHFDPFEIERQASQLRAEMIARVMTRLRHAVADALHIGKSAGSHA